MDSLITRFFRVPASHYKDGRASIVSNKDILDLDVLTDAVVLHTFDDGSLLIHAIIKSYTITAMSEMADLADPLSMAGVIELGLEDTYKGMDYSDTPYVGLFWFLPELAGTKFIDDGNGGEIEVDKLPRHHWGVEVSNI